jgi:hypothetical protein
MILFATIRSLIESALALIGLVLRVGMLAFAAACTLRLLGLVQPELLPGFWLVVSVGCIVLLPAGVSMGRRDVYREERDRTIKAAEERYKGRV